MMTPTCVLRIEIKPTATVEEAVKDMLRLARMLQVSVAGEFNSYVFVADPNDTEGEMEARVEAMMVVDRRA